MFARILVPTDFSAPAEAALACGRELAHQFGASLHLIHVAENPFLRAVAGDPRSLEDSRVRWLQERLTEADRRQGAVAIVEGSDEPAKEILRYANSAQIDLIIMGTHGRTGLARVVLGSVTEAVVRTAPCPVLTMHAAETAAMAAAREGAGRPRSSDKASGTGPGGHRQA
jgi:nucleotide-binding universal stress UspA family protein